MSDVVDQVSEQARFAAREFLARWARETEVPPSALETDRMLFAYEMGFLRGHGEGMQSTVAMFDELRKRVNG